MSSKNSLTVPWQSLSLQETSAGASIKKVSFQMLSAQPASITPSPLLAILQVSLPLKVQNLFVRQ